MDTILQAKLLHAHLALMATVHLNLTYLSTVLQATLHKAPRCKLSAILIYPRECTICPKGSYCPSTQYNPYACDDGTYSQEGQTQCNDCPAGYECPNKDELPQACPTGSYSLNKQISCTLCTAGSTCEDITSSSKTSCPSGTYAPSGSNFCLECPAGHECLTTDNDPVQCANGYYNKRGSKTACQACEAGYACKSQLEEPMPCPEGYYSEFGDQECQQCDAGYFCQNPSSQEVCQSGYFCPTGSTTQFECPIGYQCSGTSDLPTPCGKGQHSDLSSSDCQKCPRGFSCDLQNGVVKVQKGFYSPDGVTQAFICPAGHSCYDSITDLSYEAAECREGQTSAEGDYLCFDCAEGFACPDKFNPNQRIDCSQLEGYFSDQQGLSSCLICPAGFKCPKSEQDKIECLEGQYSLDGQAFCINCPPGVACPDKQKPTIFPCTLGTYSAGNQAQCTPCPENYQCNSTAFTPCPSFQYSNRGDGFCRYLKVEQRYLENSKSVVECQEGQYKQFGMLECTDCPVAHYCPRIDSSPVKCEPGTYQDETKKSSCKDCQTGYYSIFGQESCKISPEGYYITYPYQVPRICQMGTYSNSGATQCSTCKDGHICRYGETREDPPHSLCPKGFFCNYDNANNGKLLQQPCDAGFYQPLRGQTSADACIPCPAGSYCLKGSSAPLDCTQGAYCLARSTSNAEYQCEDGKYAIAFNADSSAVCIDCPAGYFCPKGAKQPVKCPVGSFCPIQQGSGDENPCPAGTYSGPFSIKDDSECQICPAGYYCPQGSVFPQQCPTGSYNQETSQTSVDQCKKCDSKRPCPFNANQESQVGLYCAHGHFCPEGTSFPTQYPCPAGTFSDDISITDISSCQQCPQKFACLEGTNSLTKLKVPCSPGHYCPAGTQHPDQFKCPAGTYSPFTDNYQLDQCIVCPAGTFCEEASVQPTGHCEPGHFCPSGSKNSTTVECPEGTYQPANGAKSRGECFVCPLGNFCLKASFNYTSCPVGTYGDTPGLKQSAHSFQKDGCKNCPPGNYCPFLALIDPNSCGAGFYSNSSSLNCTECSVDHFCNNLTTSYDEMIQNKCAFGFICNEGTQERPFHPNYSCPVGHYCQDSQIFKCPPGTYNPQIGASNMDFCLFVPPGYYTNVSGSSEYRNNICQKGFYCPANSTNAIALPCAQKSFRNIIGARSQEDCGKCPSGHYCPSNSVKSFVCPKGYYCPNDAEVPEACPKGTFGASEGLRSISECSDCYSGRYCSQKGLHQPDGLCDAGYYCISNAIIPTPTDGRMGDICPRGGYCELGSKRPSNCPPGTYNPELGLSRRDDCIPCQQGHYCAGSNNPEPTGLCDPGYFCTGGSTNPKQNAAPAGYYAEKGSSQPIQCPLGFYNPKPAQAKCLICEPGYKCPSLGMTKLIDCGTGYYCPNQTVSPEKCPKGTYNDQINAKTVADCIPCSAGKYCPFDGLISANNNCLAGSFCKKGASQGTYSRQETTEDYGACPKGHYCPEGTGMPTPCPSGTYSNRYQIVRQDQCSECEEGYYCLLSGLAEPQGKCDPGYYCPQGSKVPRPSNFYCKKGQFCPEGSVEPRTCPAGTYQHEEKSSSCIDCPQGYYCPRNSADYRQYPCIAGHYCPNATQKADQFPCPLGTFNGLTKRILLDDCILCDPGHYCNSTALTSKTGECEAGYYCFLGSPSPTPNPSSEKFNGLLVQTYGGRCQVGFYCPKGTPIQIPCPAGMYCDKIGLDVPTGNCEEGYYCIGGASTSQPNSLSNEKGDKCPVGHYCPKASSSPIPCHPGTYNPITQKTSIDDCLLCTQGSYCDQSGAGSVRSLCNEGYFCPPGQSVSTPTEYVCPIGFYCPEGSASAQPCDGTNEYQDEIGKGTCKQCIAGYECTQTSIQKCQPQKQEVSYYCPGTSNDRVMCPTGTYNMVDGSQSPTDCKPCPPGYHCPNQAGKQKIQQCQEGYYCLGGVDAYSGICPKGYFCPRGSNIPTPCPAGMYCETQGLALSTGDCSSGYYCNHKQISEPNTLKCVNGEECVRGADTSTQNLCPRGSYCPSGSASPTECPIGTYSNKLGLQSDDQCTQCEAGKFCPHRGLTEPRESCQEGYYCPAGQQTDQPAEYPCPAGSKCPFGSSNPVPCPPSTYQPYRMQAACLICPKGHYCPDYKTITPLICPKGSYCIEGIREPTQCNSGYMSNLLGLQSSSQCEFCGHGKFCEDKGMSVPSGDCFSGYYCPATEPQTSSTPSNFICPQGSYCLIGSAYHTKCPPGTLSDELGKKDDLCKSCPHSKICSQYGITSVDSLEKCPDGFLCYGGAKSNSTQDRSIIQLCPIGHYCQPNSVTPLKCPIGTYNTLVGQTSCAPCPPGYLCKAEGTVTPENCERGFYCPYNSESQKTQPVPCPAGTYSDQTNLISASECEPCPPGQFCKEKSQSPSGSCEPGYICPKGVSTPTPQGIFNAEIQEPGKCPLGHYCPIPKMHYPFKCPQGKYQDQEGQTNCKDCPPGFFCDEVGLVNPDTTKTCADGFICLGSAITPMPTDEVTGRLCKIRHFCKNGQEQPCPNGTYQNTRGHSTCLECPAGFYCNEEGGTETPVKCPFKKFCPQNAPAPITCPDGTYTPVGYEGLEDVSQCVPCPTGFYCQDGVYDTVNVCDAGYFCKSKASHASDPDMLCPAGFYCQEGTKVPKKCPDGKFSKKGAKSTSDCTNCQPGFYCVDGNSEQIPCPPGHYCPEGKQVPQPCHEGTYNVLAEQISSEDCMVCPAGALCNSTAIVNTRDHLCPPGYYCTRGSLEPTPCPKGTFRPNRAGQIESSCSPCRAGFHCPQLGTVVPKICNNGTYCPQGSVNPTDCPPGFYCKSQSQSPTQCPGGYYCPGKSELYLKCVNGTYCPEGTSSPIQCPQGTIGSGNSNNAAKEEACITCGKGQYSTFEQPGDCFACTPGYVCLGNTKTAKPQDQESSNGYKCPAGHYCPSGSYKELACPAGTYNQHEERSSLDDCIPCREGFYNDFQGQPGCKKCGPSGTSQKGSKTCDCIGQNRIFVKSFGSCLCQSGYKARNGQVDQDSSVECELIVKEECQEYQNVDLEGNCVTDPDVICAEQCQGGSGSLIEGTGICQCDRLVLADQVCDAECRQNMLIATLDKSGQLVVEDPSTQERQMINPSEIEGFMGDFKCKLQDDTQCQVYSVGKSEDGDFTYDYKVNPLALQYTENIQPNQEQRRLLQSTVPLTYQLINPVMCFKAGSSVLFSINSNGGGYPVYLKDSILNSNQNFDYGPFLNLASMIKKGISVNTFSYFFNDAGIHVFQDSKFKNKITIIGVVEANQECSSAEANVQMATAQSLASIGIQSQPKNITPKWSFVIGTFVMAIIFSFGIVGLITFLHNKNSGQRKNATSSKVTNTIYYDRIRDLEEQDFRQSQWWCCLCRKYRQLINGNKIKHFEEDDVTYKDLEHLLGDFKKQMDVLKIKLKENELEPLAPSNGDEPQKENVQESEEDQLLKEINSLKDFVNENRDCIQEFFGIKRDGDLNVENDERNEGSQFFDDQIQRDPSMANLMRDQQAKEQELQGKLNAILVETKEQAQNQFDKQNNDVKDQLLEQFKSKLSAESGHLSEGERQELVQEMMAKMDKMNFLLNKEDQNQQKRLKEMLEKRQKKKQDLNNVLNKLNDKRSTAQQGYDSQLMEIVTKEQQELKDIDKELQHEKRKELEHIQEALKHARNEKLSEYEKKLEAMKKQKNSGKDDGNDLGSMLNEYGKLVKQVEGELQLQNDQQSKDLDEKLAERKQQKNQEAEKRRKKREEQLNQEFQSKNEKANQDTEQIKSLLKPVFNEDKRLANLLENEMLPSIDSKKELHSSDQADQDQKILSKIADLESQLQQVTHEEDNKVAQLLDTMRKESDKSFKDSDLQLQTLKRDIEGTLDQNERNRLLQQFDKLKQAINSEQKKSHEDQNSRLQRALEQRRLKKQSLGFQIMQLKEKQLEDSATKISDNLTIGEVDSEQAKKVAQKILGNFEKDEVVQVVENYLEQKHMKELQKLLLDLFEEKSKALRKFIFEMMTQKQSELELIKEEFKPQYEFLKENRARGFINESDYRKMVEKLAEQETDRRMDVEIAMNEKEQQVEDELKKLGTQTSCEVEQKLKDKHTYEKLAMLDEVSNSQGDNHTIQSYLEKEKKDALKELKIFKQQKEQEKQEKIQKLQQKRLDREKELQDRESKMLNWEEKMNEEEAKHMNTFEKQKQAIIQKKLDEQKSELLREVNKDQIQQLLTQHKRDIERLQTVLEKEQERQMVNMRARLQERLKTQETGKVRREVKLAMLRKDKMKDQKQTIKIDNTSGIDFGSGYVDSEWQKCIDKVNFIRKLTDKPRYSKETVNKEHHSKKVLIQNRLLWQNDIRNSHSKNRDQCNIKAFNFSPQPLQGQSSDENLLLRK